MIKEEIILKIDDYNKSIEEKLAHFINGCYLLKDSSNGNYQVQKTITENKIYFQGYILDSKLCQKFKENNIKDYSLANLKDYISKHFNDLDTDYTPYYQALSLYEEATNLEDLIDKKINLEIDFIYNLVKEIEILKYQEIASAKLVSLYKEIKAKLLKNLSRSNPSIPVSKFKIIL